MITNDENDNERVNKLYSLNFTQPEKPRIGNSSGRVLDNYGITYAWRAYYFNDPTAGIFPLWTPRVAIPLVSLTGLAVDFHFAARNEGN